MARRKNPSSRELRGFAALENASSRRERPPSPVGESYADPTDVLSRCRAGLIAVASFSMAINVLVLTVSVYMLQVYDRVLPGRSIETLVYLTVIAAAALATMAVLDLLRSRILVRLGIWIDQALSPPLFGRALENALRGLAYRTEALRDLAVLRTYLGGAGIMALFDAPWLPIFLIFVFLLHPLLGLLAFGGAAMLIALALTNSALTARAVSRANIISTKNYQRADAIFRNAEVVDGMGMTQALMLRWSAFNADVLSLQQFASDKAALITACTKSFRMFLQIAVLGLGAWLVLRQQLSRREHGGRFDHHVARACAGRANHRVLETDKQRTRRLEAPLRDLRDAAMASAQYATTPAKGSSHRRECDLCFRRRWATRVTWHFLIAYSG